MNIFGVGGAELIAILVIMLMFAGPKRMIHWSYVLGQYVAKFRVIWSQTVDLVQKEFDEAGVDIKLPKEPPTRQNLNQAIGDAIKPVTKPLQDSIDEVKRDVDTFKDVSDSLNNKTQSAKPGAQDEVVEKQASKKDEPKVNSNAPAPAKAKTGAKPEVSSEAKPQDLGAWSGDGAAPATKTTANGESVDLGTWSAVTVDE